MYVRKGAFLVSGPAPEPPTYKATEIFDALRVLKEKHGVVTEPSVWALAEHESAFDMVLEGFAATPDVDRERMCLAAGALLPLRPVPLLWRHDENQVAGEILSLSYDSKGRLRIRARVEHDLAKRAPGFSVGISRVREWKMIDADSRRDFHARIERATLDEISLTDRPANANAVVTLRHFGDAGRRAALRSMGMKANA